MLGARSQVVVRRAKASDAEPLALVFSESWRQAYRGIIPHLHLESMIRKRGTEWWANAVKAREGILLIEVGRQVCGYTTWGNSRIRGSSEGEIYELYLTPAHQGLGFGELLFEASRHVLETRRMRGLLVWVLADNGPAVDFYWRRGGRPTLRSHDRFGRAKLEKIGFTWS